MQYKPKVSTAAGLYIHSHLICVEPPEFQFLLKERSADVCGVVKLAGPVIVEDLSKYLGVTIKEISKFTNKTKHC